MDWSEVHFKKHMPRNSERYVDRGEAFTEGGEGRLVSSSDDRDNEGKILHKGGGVQRWGDDGSYRWIEDVGGWSCFYLGRNLNNLTYGSMVLKACRGCRGAESPLSARIIPAKLKALDVWFISACAS